MWSITLECAAVEQTFLKEVLKEICNYNMKAPHKNMWELKEEYRHYKQHMTGSNHWWLTAVTDCLHLTTTTTTTTTTTAADDDGDLMLDRSEETVA